MDGFTLNSANRDFVHLGGGLNSDARLMLLGMINNGYHPGEGANLKPEHIRLDAFIHYIDIVADGRHLKTRRA